MNTLLVETAPITGLASIIETITTSATGFIKGIGNVLSSGVQIFYTEGALTDIGLIGLVFMGISVSFIGLKFVMRLFKR